MTEKNERKAWLAKFFDLLKSFGQKTGHRSPVYALIEPHAGDGNDPACATCPAAMWLVTDGLICFCKVMKTYAWTLDQAPVLVCDERERLLGENDDA